MSIVRVKRTKVVGNGVAGLKSIPPRPSKVEVGFPAGEADSDNIMKAYFNEFGTKGSGKGFKTPRGGGFGGPIPERPFLRSAMRGNRANYRSAMIQGAKEIVRAAAAGEDPHKVMRRVLRKLGIKAQGDIQESITSLTTPGNSEVTIALKGSSNPLVDTGELRASVTFKVKD